MRQNHLGYLFEAALRAAPDSTAIIQGETAVTYGQLDARANQVGNALLALGARPATRIGLMFANDFRFLECLFGVMRIGAVAVPLNARLGDEVLAGVLLDAQISILIAGGSMADRSRRIDTRIRAASRVGQRIARTARRRGRRRVHAAIHVRVDRRPQGRSSDSRWADVGCQRHAPGAVD